MRQMSLREVQEEELRLLKAFRDYCERLDIHWSLAYGTLLGAVRHGGFITWDDDIDVLVPREGYERLISSPIINDDFGIIVPGLDSGCPWLFAKFYSKRTLWNETYTRHSDRLGVFIDVFPWDSVDSSQARAYYKRVQSACKPYYYAYSFDYNDGRYKNPGGVARRIVGTLARIRPASNYRSNIEKLIARSAGRGSLVNFFSPYPFERECVDEELCKDIIPVDFEGESFPCLGDPEMHLFRVYGEDWRTPIKHEEHLHGEAFWRDK